MADMIPQGVQPEVDKGGYERGDANIRSIFVSGAVIFSTIFVVMLVVGGMMYSLNRRESASDLPFSAVYQREVPPEPRLLPSRATGDKDPYDKYPWELGAQEREAQLKAATTPYYIDKAKDQVSIPTAQAIDLVAAQGLPSRQPQGNDEPNVGEDLAGQKGMSSSATTDSDLDGSMAPDTTGGRAMSGYHIEAPSLGATEPSAISSREKAPMASDVAAPNLTMTNAR